MRWFAFFAATTALLMPELRADDSQTGWRPLPLIKDGKVHPSWVQLGYGGFVVDGDTLRTECDEKGLGLLLYRPEKFGNCQIRVVYKTKDARSNAGVYVRIDDGILNQLKENHPPARRNPDGGLTPESLKAMMEASEKEVGPWYAVHRGYEVQICDASGPFNRTGAVYSLAKAAELPPVPASGWRTMIITLQDNFVTVDVDGVRISRFDPDAKDVPTARQWYEPKREPKRPKVGYLGLQNHDPGDVVHFKEVSIRPL